MNQSGQTSDSSTWSNETISRVTLGCVRTLSTVLSSVELTNNRENRDGKAQLRLDLAPESQRGRESKGEMRRRCEGESRDGADLGVILPARWRRTEQLDIGGSDSTRSSSVPVLVEAELHAALAFAPTARLSGEQSAIQRSAKHKRKPYRSPPKGLRFGVRAYGQIRPHNRLARETHVFRELAGTRGNR